MNKSKTVFAFLLMFIVLRLVATILYFFYPLTELLGTSMLTILVTDTGSVPQFIYAGVFLLSMVLLCIPKARKVGCVFGILLMLTDIVYNGYYFWGEGSNPVHVTVVMASLLGVSLYTFCFDVSK